VQFLIKVRKIMAKLTEIKTKENETSVMEFLTKVEDEQKRKDSIEIYNLMHKITKQEGKMWGDSIIGFYKYVVTSPSGRSVEWFKVGFSPRKNYISLYLHAMQYEEEAHKLAQQLGKVKLGKGCINIKRISDINTEILTQLITLSV